MYKIIKSPELGGTIQFLLILIGGCAGGTSSERARDGGSPVDPDGDGISDASDLCPMGATGWISNSFTDNDGDGCRDRDEDAFPNDGTEHRDTDSDGLGDNLADKCPRGTSGWTSNSSTDHDGDGCRDSDEDMDDDGDSLIEITALEQLHSLRDDLNGDGSDDGRLPGVTALGNTGCPVSGCTGYELMNSLDFNNGTSYTSEAVKTLWTTGAGWPGIGSCTTANNCTSFSGDFNGNDFTITNLFINASATTNGTGLFAAANGTMSNLILMDARVSGDAGDVGIFIGYGIDSDIHNVGINGVVDSPGGSVGGLIGDGEGANVVNSYITGSVSGGASIGGLIGYGLEANVNNSYARGNVSGTFFVGGLVGFGVRANVTNSYASGSVSGVVSIGGLIGAGETASVENSYATGAVTASNGERVGGLIGVGTPATISSSYWDTNTTGQTSSVDGTGKTTAQLQNPTSFTGSIYANWASALCADGTAAWDLGTSSQYPALTCPPGGVAEQR